MEYEQGMYDLDRKIYGEKKAVERAIEREQTYGDSK